MNHHRLSRAQDESAAEDVVNVLLSGVWGRSLGTVQCIDECMCDRVDVVRGVWSFGDTCRFQAPQNTRVMQNKIDHVLDKATTPRNVNYNQIPGRHLRQRDALQTDKSSSQASFMYTFALSASPACP